MGKSVQGLIDHLDLEILKLLQEDSSVTHTALALKVGASVATCQRRVVRLKEIGVIQKEVALVDAALIGQPMTVVCEVSLTNQSYEQLEAFESLVDQAQAVQQCYRVSAGADFILVAIVPDMNGYQSFASNYLTSGHGVRNVRTFFVSRASKFSTALPLTSVQAQN